MHILLLNPKYFIFGHRTQLVVNLLFTSVWVGLVPLFFFFFLRYIIIVSLLFI